MSAILTRSAGELAKVVHAALAVNAHMQLILGDPPRLYDSAPVDPVFPYLTYGPMRSVDIGGDGTELVSHQMSLHVWSRYQGRAEVFGSLNYIADALTAEALNTNAELVIVNVNPIYVDVLRAPDGRTMHGLLRMSFSTQTIQQEAL